MNEYFENKKKRFISMLKEGMIQVAVNSKLPGVQLPPHLMGNLKVVLNLSYRFKDPIDVTDEGVYSVLSFAGVDHNINLPWGSIWGVVDKGGGKHLYPLDMSEEMRAALAVEGTVEVQSPPRPELEDVEGGGESTQPRQGHLRIVH